MVLFSLSHLQQVQASDNPRQSGCDRLAKTLDRMRHSGAQSTERLARAQAQYERRCGPRTDAGETTDVGRTPGGFQAPMESGMPLQNAAQKQPPEAMAPKPSAVKTDGYFEDWDRALDSQCDNSHAEGRTRCAQIKIDRALAERRLSLSEVEACLRPEAAAGRSAAGRSASMRELQARRMASLGGDAYWKWNGAGDCKLAERVKQTFVAEAPPKPAPAAGQSPFPCALDPMRPECRAVSELQRKSFSAWEAGFYSRCARESVPGQGRDHCARSLVEQASRGGLVSASAIEGCRAEWSRGSQGEPEFMAIHLCLTRRAQLEDAMTSTILRTTPRRMLEPALSRNGYRQPEAMAGIYAGDDGRMLEVNSDPVYFLNALAQLWEACQDPHILQVQLQLWQQARQRQRDAMERAAKGKGTREDAQVLAASFAIGLAALEDCAAKPDFAERDLCEKSKKETLSLPGSQDATHDVKLLVRRHTCNGRETVRFTRNLSSWLLMPPAKRNAMAWAARSPQLAQYQAMFENCRRQAGDGAADAWCGCYVRQFSQTQPGSRAYPVDVVATARQTAFVGEKNAWFAPDDLSVCDPFREEVLTWRRVSSSSQATTACLVGQTVIPESVAPELKACRYRTAWGEIEVRNSQCRPHLLAQLWGDEVVNCK
jgi:hypothetical protein